MVTRLEPSLVIYMVLSAWFGDLPRVRMMMLFITWFFIYFVSECTYVELILSWSSKDADYSQSDIYHIYTYC